MLLLMLLLLPTLAWAGDRVCGTATDGAAAGDGLASYTASVDTTTLPPDCAAVPAENIPAQRALVTTPGFDRRQYRVEQGLLVLKSLAVRQQIAAADAAAAAEQAAIAAEFTTNEACNVASLQEALNKIEAQRVFIQADIDAVTNIATAKTAQTTMNTRLTAIAKNLARCLFAVIKVTVR